MFQLAGPDSEDEAGKKKPGKQFSRRSVPLDLSTQTKYPKLTLVIAFLVRNSFALSLICMMVSLVGFINHDPNSLLVFVCLAVGDSFPHVAGIRVACPGLPHLDSSRFSESLRQILPGHCLLRLRKSYLCLPIPKLF